MNYKTNFLLLSIVILCASFSPRSIAKAHINSLLLGTLRHAHKDNLSICDISTTNQKVWDIRNQLYESYNLPTSKLWTEQVSYVTRENTDSINESLYHKANFYAGLALGCKQKSIEIRKRWATIGLNPVTNLDERRQNLERVGQFYFENKLWDEALPVFEALYKMHPSNWSVERLAIIYYAQGDFHKASELIEEELLLPNMVTVKNLILLADSYNRLEEYQHALTILEEAEDLQVSKPPPYPWQYLLYYQRGIALEALGDKATAIQSYENGRNLKVGHDPTLLHLLNLYRQQGSWEMAESLLNELSPTALASNQVVCWALEIKYALGRSTELHQLQQIAEQRKLACSIP